MVSRLWNFDGRHNFANARWTRGNSWLTSVIPDFLEIMNWPEHHATRCFLQQVLESQVKALQACQHSCGLWHTLLDDPQSHLKASATAGFTYGILKCGT